MSPNNAIDRDISQAPLALLIRVIANVKLKLYLSAASRMTAFGRKQPFKKHELLLRSARLGLQAALEARGKLMLGLPRRPA